MPNEENNAEIIEVKEIKTDQEEKSQEETTPEKTQEELVNELNSKISKQLELNEEVSSEFIIETTSTIVSKINDQESQFKIDHAVLSLSQILVNLLSLLVSEEDQEDENKFANEFDKARTLVNEEISQIIANGFNEDNKGASLTQFLLTSAAIIDFIYSRKIIKDFTVNDNEQ